jgi:hypothetical protein
LKLSEFEGKSCLYRLQQWWWFLKLFWMRYPFCSILPVDEGFIAPRDTRCWCHAFRCCAFMPSLDSKTRILLRTFSSPVFCCLSYESGFMIGRCDATSSLSFIFSKSHPLWFDEAMHF